MKLSLFQLLPITIIFISFSSANAQIVPDESLNEEASAIGATQPDIGIQVISGGAMRGNSLFHSFQQFSIGSGQKVYFENPSGVSDILTRVTGNEASLISGTLGVLGNANLFFLNSRGIIFTKGAQLDLRGSFLATTANSFTFPDGSGFSATNPQSAPLLTISSPLGLNFSGNPGVIQVLDTPQNQTQLPFVGTFPTPILIDGKPTGLTVDPGKTLALVGGPVTFASGIAAAPTGRIEIGAIEQGAVAVVLDPKGFTLDYSNAIAFSDIELTRFSLLNAEGFSGNQIRLQGRQISLSNGSFLAARNTGGQTDSVITVKATEALNVIGFNADPLFSLQFPGQTANAVIWSSALAGKGADIFISTPKLNLETAGIVLSTATISGTAGTISIEAGDTVRAAGFIPEVLKIGQLPSKFSGIASLAYGSGGRTGDISVGTKKLLLQDLGAVGTFSFESAAAGNLIINASDLIELKGADPASGFGTRLASITSGAGNAGNLQIDTKQLLVLDGGTVGSSTISNGNAGKVSIDASELIKVSGTVPGSAINRSRIVSAAQLQDPSLRENLGLPTLGVGNASDLTIKTGQLSIDSRGEVSVQNDGSGAAGTLTIEANSARITNQSSISGAVGSGTGGNINMSVKDIFLLQNHSEVSAAATNTANGGSIKIDTSVLFQDRSTISGRAEQGRGGEVNINVQGLFLSPNSIITATSDAGPQFSGTVQINIPAEVNFASAAANSVAPPQSPEVVSICSSQSDSSASSFVNLGTGGTSPSFNEALNSNTGWHDTSNTPQAIEKLRITQRDANSNELVPVTGWVIHSNGTMNFTSDGARNVQYSSFCKD